MTCFGPGAAMNENPTSRRNAIAGALASCAFAETFAARWRVTRTFLQSRLRPPSSTAAFVATCAGVAVLMCASAVVSPVAAIPENLEMQWTRYAVGGMKLAIEKCDYFAWLSNKRDYDTYASLGAAAAGFSPPPAPPYPFPCYETRKLRTTNIRTQPEPTKLYSVGTLFKPYVGVEGGGGWQHSSLDVIPPFDINGQGAVGGIFGGILLRPPGAPVSFGFEVGSLFGNIGGTTEHPAASLTGIYSTDFSRAIFLEGSAQIDWNALFPGSRQQESDRLALQILYSRVSAGIATIQTDIHGVGAGFDARDSFTRTGFTGSVTLGAHIPNTSLDVFGRYRYINVPQVDVLIPGRVPLSGDIHMFTGGLQFNFGVPVAPPPPP
jgi:hypothetical protein